MTHLQQDALLRLTFFKPTEQYTILTGSKFRSDSRACRSLNTVYCSHSSFKNTETVPSGKTFSAKSQGTYIARKRTRKRIFLWSLSLLNVNIKLDSPLTHLEAISLSLLLSRQYKLTFTEALNSLRTYLEAMSLSLLHQYKRTLTSRSENRPFHAQSLFSISDPAVRHTALSPVAHGKRVYIQPVSSSPGPLSSLDLCSGNCLPKPHPPRVCLEALSPSFLP